MAQTKIKLIADGVIDENHLKVGHTITTDNIGEGTNLYYTDARVGSYLSTNSYATEGYVTTTVANLVDAAPSTLDTLNELAAALGDDPNFATTVTNSIATKLPLAGGTLTGNLGIGESSPQSDIHISSSFPEIRLQDNAYPATNHYSTIDGNGGSGILSLYADKSNTAANSSIDFYVDNSLTMRVDNGGNVGIGTSSPSSLLHVNGGAEISSIGGGGVSNRTGDSVIINAGSEYSDANAFNLTGGSLELAAGAVNTTRFNDGRTYTGGDVKIYAGNAQGGGASDTRNIGNIIFGLRSVSTSGSFTDTERMRITNDGNVGIGNTAPYSKLSVNGGHYAVGISGGTSSPILQIGSDNSNGAPGSQTWSNGAGYATAIVFGQVFDNGQPYEPRRHASIYTADITSYGKGDLVFATKGTSNNDDPAEKMRITKDGKVGIRTSNPESEFEVNGRITSGAKYYSSLAVNAQLVVDFTLSTARASSFMITVSWWGDGGARRFGKAFLCTSMVNPDYGSFWELGGASKIRGDYFDTLSSTSVRFAFTNVDSFTANDVRVSILRLS